MKWIKCSDRMPEKSGVYIVASEVKRSGNRIFNVVDYSSKYGLWNSYDFEPTLADAMAHTEVFNDTEYWAEIPEVE